MKTIEIDKEILEQTAYLICSMKIDDKNPNNLRKIADMIEFWSSYLPRPPKEEVREQLKDAEKAVQEEKS